MDFVEHYLGAQRLAPSVLVRTAHEDIVDPARRLGRQGSVRVVASVEGVAGLLAYFTEAVGQINALAVHGVQAGQEADFGSLGAGVEISDQHGRQLARIDGQPLAHELSNVLDLLFADETVMELPGQVGDQEGQGAERALHLAEQQASLLVRSAPGQRDHVFDLERPARCGAVTEGNSAWKALGFREHMVVAQPCENPVAQRSLPVAHHLLE